MLSSCCATACGRVGVSSGHRVEISKRATAAAQRTASVDEALSRVEKAQAYGKEGEIEKGLEELRPH